MTSDMAPPATGSARVVGRSDRSAQRALARLTSQPALSIIALAVLARVPLVFLPITYKTDIWRQADTASIARNFLVDPNILFPAINWGGAGPGYVEAEFQLHPWIVSRLYVVLGEQVWIGRAVSLVAATLAMWWFWKLAARRLTHHAALAALVFFVMTPLFLRYSTAFMPEATTLAAYIGALLLFDRWLDDGRWPTATACAAATAVAALVKPTALHICVTFAVLLLLRREWRRLFSTQVLAFAVIVFVPVAAWLWQGVRLHDQYGNTFGVISGGDSKFGGFQYWTSPGFYTGVAEIDLVWVYAFVGAPVAAIGLVVAIRRRAPLMVPAGAVAIVVFYLSVARYAQGGLGTQYHIFTAVYAALAVGLGVHWLLQRREEGDGRARRVRVAAATVAAVLFAGGSVLAYADQFRDWGRETLDCGAAMQAVIPRGDLVVIPSGDPAFDSGTANNYQDPTLFYHGDRKGWSLAADQDQLALVQAFGQQGARWLVVTPFAYEASPALAEMVGTLPQMGPGIASGCGIYPLRTR